MMQKNEENLIVSSAPYINKGADTARIMADVLIAGIPAVFFCIYKLGWRMLAVFAVSCAACIAFEAVFLKILGRNNTAGDLSAAVTGMVLALSCPPAVPLWMVVLGDFIAIIIVKQLFGGLGGNFANPAVTAALVLSVSFSNFRLGGHSPLELFKHNEELPSYMQMLTGQFAGRLGDICGIPMIIAIVWLIVRGVSDPFAPAAYIVTVGVGAAMMGFDPIFHILASGVLTASAFMVNDPCTVPSSRTGKVIFGAGAGILTMFIRVYSGWPDGVLFSILIMNILTPQIDKLLRPRAPKDFKEAA